MIRWSQSKGARNRLGNIRNNMMGLGRSNLFGYNQSRYNKRRWSNGKIRLFWQSVISIVLLGAVIGIFSWSGQYAQKAQMVIRQYVITDYGMTPVFNFFDSVMAWGNSLEQPIQPDLPAAASLSLPADGQARPAEDSLEGMWIETVSGAELRAVMSGTITQQGQSSELGLWCELDSQTGWHFRYSHCGSLSVKEGDQVKQGEILGYVENTGENAGQIFVQVFYEGQPIDPVTFFIGQS